MVQFKKIDRVSVSEEITEYLKDQILRRQLKPGTQLPSEERMAESMGVGRGTIREALRVLLYLGLIERRNNGTFVSDPAETDIDKAGLAQQVNRHRDLLEIMELRKVIEPALAGFAAERADEEDIKELKLHCRRMAQERDNVESFIEEDNQFHLRVFQAARNYTLEEILKNVQTLMKDNQGLVIRQSPTIVPRSIDYHTRIFEAIAAGDADSARQTMIDHLNDIDQEMHSILRSRKASS
jgi:GntR family transcriptional repressor for pyruvate dehydrogenase complex